MTQGLTLLKEHHIPDWAQRFVSAGYATLLYDHRGWGSSEGIPRNEVSPFQQAEDYHDAVLFARSLPEVDRELVVIWGIGHSGGASIIAAGDDPNIKAIIAVMPFVSGKLDIAAFPPSLLDRAWKERENIATGATKAEDLAYVQPRNNSEEEANGHRGEVILHGTVPYGFIKCAVAKSNAAGTPHQNRLSLRSLYDISKAEPMDLIHKISPTPFLHLAATEDPLSGPLNKQKEAFALAGQPKEFVTLHDGHLSNYFRNFEETIAAQLAFLKKHV